MKWRYTIVLAALGLSLGAPQVRAQDKERTVPKEGLKIDGTVKRTDPKVEAQPGPRFKSLFLPAKVYLVKLSASKTYRIDMIAASQKELDAFLVVQDGTGKQLAFDDDSGGGLDARLFFSPPKDGAYKIFAAALQGEGNFTLRILEEEVVKGKLTIAQMQRLAELSGKIGEHAGAGEFSKAVRLAREMYTLREQWQGSKHWETVDARIRIDRWQRFADLTPGQQEKLASALGLSAQGRLFQSRQDSAAADEAFRKALSICQEALTEKHFQTASCYNDIASNMAGQGKRAAAHGLFQKALDIYRLALGENDLDTATGYNNLGSNLGDQDQHEEAVPLLQKALDIRRGLLGEKHPLTAATCSNLAVNLNAQAKFVAAQPLFQRSLDIRRELLGERHALTAKSYNEIAFNLDRQGKHAEAQPLFERALEIHQDVFGEQHAQTGISYNNVAFVLNAQGQHKAAQPLHEKALRIFRAVVGEEHFYTAQGYDNLAGNLNSQGNFATAQELYQKALDIRRRVFGEKSKETATSFNNVAGNLDAQGKYSAALTLHQKALDIRREKLGEKHPETALSLNNMAGNLDAQGKHAEAQFLLHQALEIRLEVLDKNHPDIAQSYNNLAMNLRAQGKHIAAQPLFRKALNIYLSLSGENGVLTAHAYNNVATNLDAQQKYEDAQPLFQKALDIYKKVLGEKNLHTARGYNNVAGNLSFQNKDAGAQLFRQKALDIYRDVAGEHHPETALGYYNAAMALSNRGQHEAARPLFQKSLDIRLEFLGTKHPDIAQSYQGLAFNLHDQKKYPEAEKLLRLALPAHDLARIDRASSGFERALGTVPSPRPLLAALLARRGESLEAWQYAEADFARGLLDDLSGSPDKSHVDPKVRLAFVRKLDERLVSFLTLDKLDADQTEMRDDLLRQRDDLLDEVSKQAAKRAAERVLPLDKIQPQIPADAALIFWIDADPDHWACVVRREGLPRWEMLRGSGKDDAWTHEDRELHRKLYDALQSPSDIPDAERTRFMNAFVKQRFDPVRKHLKAERKLPAVRKLLVVPTGAMAQVPLEALTTGYTISYVPSGSVYASLAEKHRPTQASPLLALGDPIFAAPTVKQEPAPAHGLFVQMVLPGSAAAKAGIQGGDVLLRYNDLPLKADADLKFSDEGAPVKAVIWRDGLEKTVRVTAGKLGAVFDKRPAPEAVAAWRDTKSMLASLQNTGHPRLPATRFEAQALTKLVGEKQTTLLLGSDASEQALDALGKGGLKKFRVMHFGTHGDVDQFDPYRSALILAQDCLPDGPDAARKDKKVYNGQLTVETILRHWHLDADLVVLSACRTALGKPADGEGHLGFAQAFLQKGARSVVLSRWKVDDTATALLMVRFYENAQGKRKNLKAPLGRAEALDEARVWLRTLSRDDAEHLAAGLTGGVLRGSERDELPPVPMGSKVNLPAGERPFAHPFYWASFVLTGDPN